MIPYGIDVSHHQNPTLATWELYGAGAGFCIARTSYGRFADELVMDHLTNARAVGMAVGIYHFFRISQPVWPQFETMRKQARLAGYGRPGDIVAALDIEGDVEPVKTPVAHEWAPKCEEFVELIRQEWGDCMVYITQRDFGMLGSPAWVLERPLWVAHYTTRPTPATPGDRPAVIWQHRVGPFVANGPGGIVKNQALLDQNRLLGELPLLQQKVPAADVERDDGVEDAIHEWVCAEQTNIHEIVDEERHAAMRES